MIQKQLQIALGPDYSVERELGGGGMSRVFVAHDSALDRQIVVKVLPPELAAAVYLDRFHREIKLAARLQHPHIVPLLSAGEANGLLWFTMPYIDGESLRAKLALGEDFTIPAVTRLLREVASALAYAHDSGVVHRDIKPENVLMSHDSAMVTDFGVAKALRAAARSDADPLTSEGVVLGTPIYMAPEQGCGDPDTDHRADIYTLGVVAYEILTGKAPFAGRAREALMAAHVMEKPAPVNGHRGGIPDSLSGLVMKCLEKDPADRPQHANDIVAVLDKIGTDSGNHDRRGEGIGASIAVLPFSNLSADKENEYFSDGVTEEILSALQSIPSLRVAARTSSFALKGKNLTASEIGDQLKVETVLEGSVRRADRRVRINVQLVNSRNGYRIWSDKYDREVEDVFAIQEEIARNIVERLKVTLTSGENRALAKRRTDNFEAYELYLRGRHFTQKGRMNSAIACFEQALNLDPKYALALHGRAECYGSLGVYCAIPPAVAMPLARAAALRAAELAPDLAEARTSLAFIQGLNWEWSAARASLEAAMELDPQYAMAHAFSAWLLATIGHSEEAAAAARVAQELDPLSPVANGIAALVAYQARDFNASIHAGQRSLELDPTDFTGLFATSVSYAAAGNHEDAIRYSERGVGLLPESTFLQALLGAVNAMAGRVDAARATLANLEERATKGYVSPLILSWIHCNLGEADRAFELPEKAYDEHSCTLGFGEWHVPMYDPIRANPRFGPFVEKVKAAAEAN